MGYSIQGLLSGFPDGLYLVQIKKMLQQAGYKVGRSELLEELKNSERYCVSHGKWFIKTEQSIKQQELNNELAVAVRDLTKSLQNFVLVLKKSKIELPETSESSDSSGSDSKSESKNDSNKDKMPRKFWVKRPPVRSRDARTKQY